MAIEIKGTRANGQETTVSVDESLPLETQRMVLGGVVETLSHVTIKQGPPAGSFSVKELAEPTKPSLLDEVARDADK
jgi:hypothetical protein